MKKLLMFVCFLYSSASLASNATDIMAEILIDLNHFPTETDQTFLDEILAQDDSTKDEKVLANIIGRIAHKPDAEDVSALVRLSRTKSPEIQALANAILSIDHQVSDDQKLTLEAMVGE